MHTYVRLTGYGLAIAPRAPYVVRRVGDGTDGVIAVDHGGERRFFVPGTDPDLQPVADVAAGRPEPEWVLEIGGFRFPWPNHFSVAASDLDGVPFELWGGQGSNVHLQGPFRPAPTTEQLTSPGQALVDQGDGWIDLAYDVDGTPWVMRHLTTADGLVVTGQDLRDCGDGALAVATDLARAVR